MVRTLGFHPRNRGSIPRGPTRVATDEHLKKAVSDVNCEPDFLECEEGAALHRIGQKYAN